MSRTKDYEIDDVLCKAMHVFWEKGFEATSVQDLVNATGLNRYSMYEAFGSKEGVLHASLDTYRDEVATTMLDSLNDRSFHGLAGIKNFFSTLRNAFTGPGSENGCLFINSAVEGPCLDEASRHKVNLHLTRLEKQLRIRLNEAAATGEISPNANLQALARSFMAIALGSGVIARSPLSHATVSGAFEGAVTLIDLLETAS